jgi:hypothetical protein
MPAALETIVSPFFFSPEFVFWVLAPLLFASFRCQRFHYGDVL